MAKKIRDTIFVLTCIAALFVSSISACACAHHEGRTETADCHQHSHESKAVRPDSRDFHATSPERHSHVHPAANLEKHSYKNESAVSQTHAHEHSISDSEKSPHKLEIASSEKDSYEKQAADSSNNETVDTGFGFASDPDCFCFEAAPKVASNSKQLKPLKYTSAGSALVTIEPAYDTAITLISNFIISRFLPNDSLYNLSPGRAPPRL